MNVHDLKGSDSTPDGFRSLAAALLIAAVFALLSLPGLESLPLDKHEGLVLQSAKEMHVRGDWIVPWFNAEPRLNKPPFSYWATLATAWIRGGGSISGSVGEPAILDARIPSLLAMFGCLLLIPVLARKFTEPGAGPAVGGLAAALFAASPAVAVFAQDARPDPLYAFFCVAGTACLIADRARPFPTRLAALGGWALFALATLTKGPHIPLFLIIALVLTQRSRGGGLRNAVCALRPISGLALFALLTLPWWWALGRQLGSETIAASQLGGELYQPSWRGLSEAYREALGPVVLLFPWSLIPLLHWRQTRALWRFDTNFRRLALLCLVPLSLTLISPQHRWHYPLPIVPLFAVLCSMVLTGWLRTLEATARPSAGWALGAVFAVMLGVLASNAFTGWLQDPVRIERVRQLQILTEPRFDAWPIVADRGIDSALEVAVAISSRPIEVIDQPEDLAAALIGKSRECLLVILPEEHRDLLPDSMRIVQLAQWADRDTRLAILVVTDAHGAKCFQDHEDSHSSAMTNDSMHQFPDH
jgi:4-amino-4-deoxy-L-arabinose transferase-like glycosyltransferase